MSKRQAVGISWLWGRHHEENKQYASLKDKNWNLKPLKPLHSLFQFLSGSKKESVANNSCLAKSGHPIGPTWVLPQNAAMIFHGVFHASKQLMRKCHGRPASLDLNDHNSPVADAVWKSSNKSTNMTGQMLLLSKGYWIHLFSPLTQPWKDLWKMNSVAAPEEWMTSFKRHHCLPVNATGHALEQRQHRPQRHLKNTNLLSTFRCTISQERTSHKSHNKASWILTSFPNFRIFL